MIHDSLFLPYLRGTVETVADSLKELAGVDGDLELAVRPQGLEIASSEFSAYLTLHVENDVRSLNLVSPVGTVERDHFFSDLVQSHIYELAEPCISVRLIQVKGSDVIALHSSFPVISFEVQEVILMIFRFFRERSLRVFGLRQVFPEISPWMPEGPSTEESWGFGIQELLLSLRALGRNWS
jgi:hypothetical protein